MKSWLGRPVFHAAGREYSLGDVILAARQRGDWEELERTAHESLACLKRSEHEGSPAAGGDVEAAAREFRYERDLISAEDMQRWLDHWGFEVDEWLDWVRASVLRMNWSAQLPGTLETYTVSEEELERFLPLEAVCSGFLSRFALSLAERAAVYSHIPGGETTRDVESRKDPMSESDQHPASGSDGHLERLESAFQRYCEQAITPKAIQEQVSAHYLDWVRFDCQLASFATIEAAREAALCVREDGCELAQIAREAHGTFRESRFYLDDMDAELRDGLLGAARGELIGPLAWNGQQALLLVLEKALPSDADPDVRRRAEEGALKRMLGREVDAHVEWLGSLD